MRSDCNHDGNAQEQPATPAKKWGNLSTAPKQRYEYMQEATSLQAKTRRSGIGRHALSQPWSASSSSYLVVEVYHDNGNAPATAKGMISTAPLVESI
jgi:predicted acetyltransferase